MISRSVLRGGFCKRISSPIPRVHESFPLFTRRGSRCCWCAASGTCKPRGETETVNLPDLAIYVRSRNRLGYYDAPTQAKLFWWGKRYHVNPYFFAPGGNERAGYHERGGGALAEFDLLGHGRTVFGVNALHGTSGLLNRTLVGPYARLGFGKWGIFAEHDITDRTLLQTNTSFRQNASYAQLFWAVREWLVPAISGERLTVERPYREAWVGGGAQITARLTPQFTLAASARILHNQVNGRTAPAITLQLAMKTPN